MHTLQTKGEPHFRAIIDSSWGERFAYISAESIDAAREKLSAELGEHDSIREIEPREPRYGFTLIMGGYRWGSGKTLDDAKREFRAQGGKLSDGYGVIVFDDETDFCGVDGMGRYSFIGNPPIEQRAVEPRKR